MKSILSLLLLMLLLQSQCGMVNGDMTTNFWDYLARFFNPSNSNRPVCTMVNSSFCPVSSNVGLDNVTGWVYSFGDFNSDKYTDVFVANGSTLSVYLWRTKYWDFSHDMDVEVNGVDVIQNIIAADFNHDGRLDLLVQGSLDSDPEKNILVWYSGNYTHLKFEAELPYSQNQVTVIDYDGDVVPDLLGNKNNTRYIWMNNPPGTFTLKKMSENEHIPFSKIHSNSFLDFNGDCIPDLFLTTSNSNGTNNYEILVRDVVNGKWKYAYENIAGVAGMGQISFFDMNSDGSSDVIFPVCDGVSNCSIHIVYNVQNEICQSFLDKDCITTSTLCVSGGLDFSFDNFNSAPGENVVIVDTQSMIINGAYGPGFHFGDFNLDGYPDILVPVGTGESSHIEIWQNVECDDILCTPEATKKNRRTFQHFLKGVKDLESIAYPVAAAFVDLDEDGINDIIVLTDDGSQKKIYAFENNILTDNFFLKTLGLNGVCTERCSTGEYLPDPKPYGVNQFGATFRFTFTTLDAIRQLRNIPQLSQSAFMSLQTPYTLSGLGRPSNYIDFLAMGLPSGTMDRFNSWPGIIPNSQVVAIPFPVENPESWIIELYLAPSSMTLYILIAVFIALLVNGIIICILSLNEKEQDKSNQPLLLSTMA